MQQNESKKYNNEDLTDIELVVIRYKQIEAALETKFGAQGKGLHEKITSISKSIPTEDIKKMRYVATIRNKIIHEVGYDCVDDRGGFIKTCNMVDKHLQEITPSKRGGCLGFVTGVFTVFVVFTIYILHRSF
jgi:hypothetical protein